MITHQQTVTYLGTGILILPHQGLRSCRSNMQVSDRKLKVTSTEDFRASAMSSSEFIGGAIGN